MQGDSSDGDRKSLVLAVLNTTPTVDGTQRDLLVSPGGAALIERWGGDAEMSLPALVAARDAVQEMLTTGAVGSKLSGVLTRQVVQRPELGAEGLTWRLEAPPPSLLAIKFLTAWTQLTAEHPGRIRRCANPDCSLFLIDHSNANGRTWCSMTSCGNRMKARRHHQRKTRRE